LLPGSSALVQVAKLGVPVAGAANRFLADATAIGRTELYMEPVGATIPERLPGLPERKILQKFRAVGDRQTGTDEAMRKTRIFCFAAISPDSFGYGCVDVG